MTKLFIIVPCCNEQEALPAAAAALREKLASMTAAGMISYDSRIVLIDDGSHDRTWQLIADLHRGDPVFRGIRLSRNVGQQKALAAGLMTVCDEADAVITIDADLQDDINAFDEMLRATSSTAYAPNAIPTAFSSVLPPRVITKCSTGSGQRRYSTTRISV